MDAQDDVREAMLAAVPNLRAFAISLCGNIDRANDLVQETLLRAWGRPRFVRAWHQHVGVAVHNPAESFSQRIP